MNITPCKAIRKKCLECSGGSANEARLCHLNKCPLWHYRLGTGKRIKPNDGEKLLTPCKSIRAFCVECSVFHTTEVRNCDIFECVLYPFRMGKNPNRSGIGNKKAFIQS